MSLSKGLAAANAIEGWFSPTEGRRLSHLAAHVPEAQEIVEIGAFRGRSTAFLAADSPKAHITSLDDWGPAALPGGTDQDAADEVLADYHRTLEAVGGWAFVTPLRARSTAIAPFWLKPIGLLFIDATHYYDDTVADLRSWGAHVVPGGMAAFHDYHPEYPGVVRAVDEAIGNGWEHVDLTGTLRVLRRTV